MCAVVTNLGWFGCNFYLIGLGVIFICFYIFYLTRTSVFVLELGLGIYFLNFVLLHIFSLSSVLGYN